jgi:excisionase family DNA binding protein
VNNAEALSIPDAAELLGISARTLYRLIQEGEFGCPAAVVWFGHTKKIKGPLLMRWLAGEVDGDGQPIPLRPKVKREVAS